jgi:DNA helicase II / ATP-dependent DNA helicase PcrA
MTFLPSPEQAAIFSALASGSDNMLITAVAGSGKTTTIVEAAKTHLPKAISCRFLAFNKNIQEELALRLPPTVTVTTFHSVGLKALRRVYPKAVLDKDKSFTILKQRLSPREFGLMASVVSRLVSFAKNVGFGTDAASAPEENSDSWFNLAAHFNHDFGDNDEERVVEVAQKLLTTSSTEPVGSFDFDDMLYLPLRLRLSFDRTNYIFIDEAQDTNCVQRALLHEMLHAAPYGRLIAVGDPSQAIYGFRGADADAIAALKREFGMVTYPLSVSYRCSKAVVKEAQKYITQNS